MARQRDNLRCVLTSDLSNDVAHIYPFFSLQNKEEDTFGSRHIFWDYLRIFWPEEKVAAWMAELFPQGINEIGVERVYNLITLSGDTHNKWNRGAFALKPISMNEDKTTLKVQFFWQKKQNTQETMSLLTTPFSTADLDQNEGAWEDGPVIIFNQDGRKIKSGDIFELTTDDAIVRPLPSFQLLELQWFLTRVVGMAGAGFPESDWYNVDSDGEISNLGLDNVEDDSILFENPETPEFVRKDNPLFVKGSEHHTDEVEGDGVGA